MLRRLDALGVHATMAQLRCRAESPEYFAGFSNWESPVMRSALVMLLAVLLGASSTWAAEGESKEEPAPEQIITIAEGRFQLIAPKDWVRKVPRVRIIEHEFEVPAPEDDEQGRPARLTVMGAGGRVKENIQRWLDQFVQPDGSSTEEQAKIEKLTVADQTVHFVDVAGTYVDPFSQAGPQQDYRLLGAIIETKRGNYFVKLVGPAKTLAAHEQAFKDMINGLERK